MSVFPYAWTAVVLALVAATGCNSPGLDVGEVSAARPKLDEHRAVAREQPTEVKSRAPSPPAAPCPPKGFFKNNDSAAVERRLATKLDVLLQRAGLENLGGDHAFFDASAIVRSPRALVYLYPHQLACSKGRGLRAPQTHVVNGIQVLVGRRHGQPAATFQCQGVVHDIASSRNAHVRRVVNTLTAAVSDCS